ncbi:T6SS immunity protein Tli4 family protein [Luteimonas sp. A501]
MSPHHLQTLREIRDYQPVGGVQARRECLGRLVFDAPDNLEWAVSPDVEDIPEAMQFPDGVPGARGERFRYQQLNIRVSYPLPVEWVQQRRDKFIKSKEKNIRDWKAEIPGIEATLAEKKAAKEDLLARSYQRDIDEANKFIAMWEAWKIVDLGLPDSFAYQDDKSIYHLFLHRQGRLFYIRAYGEGEAQKQDAAWLRELMSRFRAREAYEIPTEPGICYPYAFLADDGTGDYHAKATFRYLDRPGVVYTLDTGLVVGVDAGEARRPQPAALWAGTLSASGLLAGPLTAGRKQEIIGLRGAKLGPVGADQGGMSLNTADEGEPEVMSYAVYTGNDGVEGIQAWPFIAVEMQSFTRRQINSLEQDPPPLAESRKRLDKLLRNLYLRPTTLMMPELQKLP